MTLSFDPSIIFNVSATSTVEHRMPPPFAWTLKLIQIFSTTKMKHLAAYLLCGLGGNTEPSADDIKTVLSSVGIDADEERLDKLIEELKGKDLQEVCIVPRFSSLELGLMVIGSS